jgi:hypothetical protein
MLSDTKQGQAIFPSAPTESPAVTKDGEFTALWSLGFGSLFQALQNNFKNEGIMIPPLTQENANTIQALYQDYINETYENLTLNLPDISGQTIYNSSSKITNQFVIAQDGDGKVIFAEWVPIATMLTNSGNPNGSLAGVLNWLCYDTNNKILYICTTAGKPIDAVWSPI